jgi:hypothetical protein
VATLFILLSMPLKHKVCVAALVYFENKKPIAFEENQTIQNIFEEMDKFKVFLASLRLIES